MPDADSTPPKTSASPADDVGRAPSAPVLLAVGLASAAAILLQVALTRVFSIALWHHFAYLVVGIALLGFGVAGSYLSLQKPASFAELAQLLARRACFAAALTLLSLMLALLIRCNALELLRSLSTAIALLAIIVLASLPFVGVGLVLGTALAGYPGRAGRVYAADLLGGASAGVMAVLLLPVLGALGLVTLATGFLCGAAVLFAIRVERRLVYFLTGLLCLAGSLAFLADEDGWIAVAPNKELTLYHRPDLGIRKVERRQWTAEGRVDVSREFPGPYVVAGEVNHPSDVYHLHAFTQDGSAPTTLHRVDRDFTELKFLDHASTAAVWKLRGGRFGAPRSPAGADVLVIGPGGGIDVMLALSFGARSVTGVEINPAIAGMMAGPYREFSGNLLGRPGVQWVVSEGRAFVRSSDAQYDVIQLAGVDTFTALSQGAYSLAEAHLYTRQAFRDFLRRLKPQGCLSVSRLILDPPRETLRLAVTALDALEKGGAEGGNRHIAVLRAQVWATLLVCKSPIAEPALQRLRDFADTDGFSLAYDPALTKSGPFASALNGSPAERAAFIDSYTYAIDPATDEAPFFFNYYRFRNLAQLGQLATASEYGAIYGSDVPIGHAVLLASLVFTSLLGAVFILVPLRRLGVKPSPERRRALLYFAGLGVAFLFVEVALVQRLTFLLGHPTYAFTVVLSALLSSAGVGALLSRRFNEPKRLKLLNVLLPLAIVLAALASGYLLPRAVALSFPLRVLTALALTVPLGLCMGMPFPLGLERVRHGHQSLVAWAFGVNAFFTVGAAAVAPLLAMQIGYSALIGCGAMLYALTLLLLARFPGARPAG